MSRFALATLSIFMCLSGCGKKTETTMGGDSSTAQLEQTEQNHGERIKMLKERLEASIQNADRQYAEYETFISLLLNDGVEQGKSIVCCWSRSLRLRDVGAPEAFEAEKSLQQLVKEQGFIRFFASDVPCYGCKQTNLFLSVIPSTPYGEKGHDFGQGRAWNGNYFYSEYHLKCEKRFKAAIPGGAEARNNERRTYASLIISSIRRLKRYEAKIPALEDTASKALAAGVVLAKLRQDIEIDVLDPSTAEDKIKEYQEFLNRAAQDLDGARREMATDPEVTNKEVDDVLKQM